MGCGSSVTKRSSAEPRQRPEYVRKISVLDINAPVIPITLGSNVHFPPFGTTPIIFIFGGPGSGKGRIVANLRSMFGMKLISAENIVLKYLPKKVQHFITLSTTNDIAELVRREPSHVQLDWVLRLIQHIITADPHHVYIVDLVPNLKWLVRNTSLVKECAAELAAFEEKTPACFAIHLSLTEDSLNKTLDYSHKALHVPQGATVADEADSTRTKGRFQLHEGAIQPFITYFSSLGRLVTMDVSCGASGPVWDCIHKFFIDQNLPAQVLVDSVVVFAMDGLQAGNLDLTNCDLTPIYLKEVVRDPHAPLETLIEALYKQLHKLAGLHPYFVVDPEGTAVMSAVIQQRGDKMVVFSDVPDKEEGCINKFAVKLNLLMTSATILPFSWPPTIQPTQGSSHDLSQGPTPSINHVTSRGPTPTFGT
ncbi:hypothetical protein EMCRGX_G023719 [Ephydatia muelleri]